MAPMQVLPEEREVWALWQRWLRQPTGGANARSPHVRGLATSRAASAPVAGHAARRLKSYRPRSILQRFALIDRSARQSRAAFAARPRCETFTFAQSFTRKSASLISRSAGESVTFCPPDHHRATHGETPRGLRGSVPLFEKWTSWPRSLHELFGIRGHWCGRFPSDNEVFCNLRIFFATWRKKSQVTNIFHAIGKNFLNLRSFIANCDYFQRQWEKFPQLPNFFRTVRFFFLRESSESSETSVFLRVAAGQLFAAADSRPFVGPPLPRLGRRDALRRASGS